MVPPDLVRSGGGWYCPDDPGEPTTLQARISISDEEAKILAVLGAGRLVIEIGTGLGVSTRALARFARRVVTHDIDEWVWRSVWPTLPSNVMCVDTREALHKFPADLVFIDADHSTDAVMHDVEFARSLLPDVIVLHDTNYPNVERAILALDGDWFTIDTEHGLGIGQ